MLAVQTGDGFSTVRFLLPLLLKKVTASGRKQKRARFAMAVNLNANPPLGSQLQWSRLSLRRPAIRRAREVMILLRGVGRKAHGSCNLFSRIGSGYDSGRVLRLQSGRNEYQFWQ